MFDETQNKNGCQAQKFSDEISNSYGKDLSQSELDSHTENREGKDSKDDADE